MPTHVRSHAKINLGLAIGPARADGYHALATIYQTLAIYDRVTVTAQPAPHGEMGSLQMTCNDARVPCDARNTAWRMVEFALDAMDIQADVTIHIEKKLPVQGGLGAGSANAAAALLGLERELRRELPQAQRLELAAKVGSDVPVFLVGGTVLGAGRGERVTPLPDLPAIACVLALPPVGVSTPQAFRDWDARLLATQRQAAAANIFHSVLTNLRAPDRLVELSRRWVNALTSPPENAAAASGVFSQEDRAEEALLRLGRAGIANDFETVVFPQYPSLHSILETMRIFPKGTGALYAALSGSGSALFGLYATKEGAEAVARRLRDSGTPALCTETIAHEAYWRDMFNAAEPE
jgi:4-diphosphocytidyl-2-C-methyl-D-erythritol kinase